MNSRKVEHGFRMISAGIPKGIRIMMFQHSGGFRSKASRS